MTKCPGCGSDNIYNSGFTIECATSGCTNFSVKQQHAELLRVRDEAGEVDCIAVESTLRGVVPGNGRIPSRRGFYQIHYSRKQGYLGIEFDGDCTELWRGPNRKLYDEARLDVDKHRSASGYRGVDPEPADRTRTPDEKRHAAIKADIDKKLSNPHDPLGAITDAIKQKLTSAVDECNRVANSQRLGSSLSLGTGTKINPRSDVKFFTERDDRSKAHLGDLYLDIRKNEIYVLTNYPPAHWERVATRAPQEPMGPKVIRMMMLPHLDFRVTNKSLHHSVDVAHVEESPDYYHEGSRILGPEAPPWEMLYKHRENLSSQRVAFIASAQVGLDISVRSNIPSARVRAWKLAKTLRPGDSLVFTTKDLEDLAPTR